MGCTFPEYGCRFKCEVCCLTICGVLLLRVALFIEEFLFAEYREKEEEKEENKR